MGLGKGVLLVGRGWPDVIEERSVLCSESASFPDFDRQERAKSAQ